MQLLTAAAALGAMPFRSQGAEVPWLTEVGPGSTTPIPPDRPLEPLLIADDGTKIDSVQSWELRREALRRAWLDFLGPMPDKRPDVALKILSEERLDGVLRQRVRFAAEEGVPGEGYLLRPLDADASRKRAGVVALHSTTNDNIAEIAGVTGRPSRHFGLQLVRRGFVVFCPRNFLWQEAADYRQAVQKLRERHPRTLGMHKMLWDAMRGVDVLESLVDFVDPRRIGAMGHSLGAKQVLYLAAFDRRVRASVASEGGVGFRFTNWDAPWYLGEAIHAADFVLNHHQLLALAAPRPFLILAGEQGPGAADGQRTWPYVAAAAEVYRLYGEPVRLAMYNHRQGHDVPPLAQKRLVQWLECYLG
jgi:hypothetical protein